MVCTLLMFQLISPCILCFTSCLSPFEQIFCGYHILNAVSVHIFRDTIWSDECQVNCFAAFLRLVEAYGFVSHAFVISFLYCVFSR